MKGKEPNLLVWVGRAWNAVKSAGQRNSKEVITVIVVRISIARERTIVVVFEALITTRNVINVISKSLAHSKLEGNVPLRTIDVLDAHAEWNGGLHIAVLGRLFSVA